jgi:hypothetical protein
MAANASATQATTHAQGNEETRKRFSGGAGTCPLGSAKMRAFMGERQQSRGGWGKGNDRASSGRVGVAPDRPEDAATGPDVWERNRPSPPQVLRRSRKP